MQSWVDGFQLSLDFIEENLASSQEIRDIAQIAALSPFYYQRIFGALCGMTVGEYIRARRMTLAAQELSGIDPKTTVNVVIACFMVAHITGMTMTAAFLTALILVTVELSLASPGTATAWTIMFETLSMPTGYVGLCSIYRVFTSNYGAGCTEACMLLEQVEAAHKMSSIQPQSGSESAETQ